jgi:hypothetical protein
MALTIAGKKKYLQDHFKYHLMNSWNQMVSYAHKVKIRDFVPASLRDEAYQLIDSSASEFLFNDMEDLFKEKSNGYRFTQNGRSGGYIVFYPPDGKPCGYVNRYGEDYEDWSYQQIKEEYELVKIFDEVIEEFKRAFILMCEDATTVEQAKQDEEMHQIKEVIIDVSGGVAHVRQTPIGIKVRIIDHDRNEDEIGDSITQYEPGNGLVTYEA